AGGAADGLAVEHIERVGSADARRARGIEIAVGAHHVGAVGGERTRRLPPDPAPRADDHGSAPVEAEQLGIGHGRITAMRVTVSSSTANRGPSRPMPESFTPP